MTDRHWQRSFFTAAANWLQCRRWGLYPGEDPQQSRVGALIGELDWQAELWRIINERRLIPMTSSPIPHPSSDTEAQICATHDRQREEDARQAICIRHPWEVWRDTDAPNGVHAELLGRFSNLDCAVQVAGARGGWVHGPAIIIDAYECLSRYTRAGGIR